jgi:succinate-semialdehyde dehydrogenase/glutarate-semialdehyde dehydrogenase
MPESALHMPDMRPAYPELALYIDGRWTRGTGGRAIAVVDPGTEQALAELPAASEADVEAAIGAAERAFPAWRDMAPARRGAILLKAAALLRQRMDEISAVMAMELGKPVADGPAEIERAAGLLEWHAAEGLRAYGRVIPAQAGLRQTVLRRPIGPVAAFTPWNGPGASPARKISAALAAGCTVVIKPAEETPATALLIVRCFEEAGVPPGVVNMVFGEPAMISRALISSPAIRLVTFTGSVPVGRLLAELAGRHLKPLILELGGHSPVIVCADADPARAAALAAKSKYRNGGQICVSPTRFFVHDDVYRAFADAFVAQAEAIRVGSALSPDTQMGPLANGRRRGAIEALIANARDAGATIATGARRIGERGFFYAPTVLTDVPEAAEVLRSEPFGPLAILRRFADLDEACRRANDTAYGLAAYAFTDSARAANLIAERVDAGILSINHFGGASPEVPFGGVKDSGYGREGGAECFDGYLVSKLVSHLA